VKKSREESKIIISHAKQSSKLVFPLPLTDRYTRFSIFSFFGVLGAFLAKQITTRTQEIENRT